VCLSSPVFLVFLPWGINIKKNENTHFFTSFWSSPHRLLHDTIFKLDFWPPLTKIRTRYVSVFGINQIGKNQKRWGRNLPIMVNHSQLRSITTRIKKKERQFFIARENNFLSWLIHEKWHYFNGTCWYLVSFSVVLRFKNWIGMMWWFTKSSYFYHKRKPPKIPHNPPLFQRIFKNFVGSLM
jgi:hypothetical protein